MSENHELEKAKNARKLEEARHKYKTFLRRLDASPTVCLGPNDCDHNPKDIVEVSRTAALDYFLRKNPPYEEFRGDLSKVHSHKKKFLFDGELWDEERGEVVGTR